MTYRILLRGTDNTRDLGGMIGWQGRKIKPRRLIRSDHLNQITEKDAKFLLMDYHLTKIIDLRNWDEIKRQPDLIIDGSSYLRLPIKSEPEKALRNEGDGSSKAIAESMVSIVRDRMGGDVIKYNSALYAKYTSEIHTRIQLGYFIEKLLQNDNGAVLWHCAAGKDRTGVCAMLIETVLGVSPETVRADYLASNIYLKVRIDNIVDFIKIATDDPAIINQIVLWCQVLPEYYEAVMNEIREKWETPENYIKKAIGISAEDIDRLREMYLE